MFRGVFAVVLMTGVACAQAPETPASRIVELARQLAGKPNDAALHARLAVAYFERGAAGDAVRVQAHSSRALALDPGVESELNQLLEAAEAGTDVTARTSEAELADMQTAAALPVAAIGKSDAAIRSKLAARLARARFAPPSTKYSKNVEVVEKLYDPATDPEPMSWSERTGQLRSGAVEATDPLTKRFVEVLRRTMATRAAAQAARATDATADDPPDVMLTKGQAYLSYLDGNVEEAVKLLKSTAAAADTLSKRALERMSKEEDDRVSAAPNLAGTVRGTAVGAPVDGAPVEDDWGDDSGAERARVSTRRGSKVAALTTPEDDFDGPRRDDGTTPDRNDPLTPPRTDDGADQTPPRAQTPPRSQGGTPDRTQTPPRVDATTPDRTATPARTDATTPDRTATPARTDATTPDRTATPPRADPVAPPRTDTPTRTDPPQPTRDQPSAPPPAPPEALRRIGQQALEGLEATRTGEVPPPEVTTKLRELAQTAEVGEPLVVDLDGDGVPSIPGGLAPDGRVEPGAAVRFDIDGDGHVDVVEWMRRGDALICADVDGDGLITSGRELPGALPGHGDSIAWLERRDLDGDGALTGRELRGISVWKDDGDARVQAGELVSAETAELTRIQIHGASGCRAIVAGADLAAWEWWPDQGALEVAAVTAGRNSPQRAQSSQRENRAGVARGAGDLAEAGEFSGGPGRARGGDLAESGEASGTRGRARGGDLAESGEASTVWERVGGAGPGSVGSGVLGR